MLGAAGQGRHGCGSGRQLCRDQLLRCWIHQEVLAAQEVYADDWKPHFGFEELPAMKRAAETDGDF
jgi:hypothetical protein